MIDETIDKLDNIISTLPVWDKVDALEYLGIKLDLTDEEQVDIAGEKARAEKNTNKKIEEPAAILFRGQIILSEEVKENFAECKQYLNTPKNKKMIK